MRWDLSSSLDRAAMYAIDSVEYLSDISGNDYDTDNVWSLDTDFSFDDDFDYIDADDAVFRPPYWFLI